MKYAAQTSVSVEKSRGEIESTLSRYGATKFAYMTDENRAMIAFEIKGKRIRFILPLPEKSKFSKGMRYRRQITLSPEQTHIAWEQACRQRWRALALAVKAKLEWVETGIVTVEEEFLPYIVTANGKTVAELLTPQLNQLYESGRVPKLLMEGSPN